MPPIRLVSLLLFIAYLMRVHSKIEDSIDGSRFLRDYGNPVCAGVVNALASNTSHWKDVGFDKTPVGCPIPKVGEGWDPVISSRPFRPYIAPKGVLVADGVLVMMRLYYELPSNVSGITLADLQQINGFDQQGRVQRLEMKTQRAHESTVLDVNGNLMTIDGTVMRGNKALDARRHPGPTNETNFLKGGGVDKQLWFNRLFNGANNPSLGIGAAFAQKSLTDYGYYIHNDDLNSVRHVDATRQERYKQYYSTTLARRYGSIERILPPNPKSAQNLKLRLNMKIAENTKPKPGSAPAVSIQSNEDKEREGSEEDMPVVRKRRKPMSGSEISAKANDLVADSLRGCIRDKNNKEGNEEIVSGSTRAFARLSTEKALNMPETPALVPINNITPAPVETSAERAIKVKKELVARTKEVEEMKRELKEIEEMAAAEKAAAEEAAKRRPQRKLPMREPPMRAPPLRRPLQN